MELNINPNHDDDKQMVETMKAQRKKYSPTRFESETDFEDIAEHEITIPFARNNDADIDELINKKLSADFVFTQPVIVEKQPQPDPELTPKPSQAQINASAAAFIGKNAAERAHQRAYTSAYKEQHAQRQFVKEVDSSDPIIQEKIPICRRLNSYQRAYKGKIHFVFKQDYNPGDPRLTLTALQSWEEQIQLCLNSRGIPKIINGGIVLIAALIERTTIAYDPVFNAPAIVAN